MFKKNLVNKITKVRTTYDVYRISSAVRKS